MNGWQIAGCVAGYILGAIITSAYAEANGEYGEYSTVGSQEVALFVVFWWIGCFLLVQRALIDSFCSRKRRRQERQEEAERMKAAAKKALGEVME